METSTFKTSTILVSTGRRTRVFRSMQEVPVRLRDKLHANISGPNARTLIVADRRGREYLIRSLRRSTKSTVHVSTRRAQAAEVPGRWAEARKYWLEIGLVGMLGVASWVLFTWK